MVTLTNMFYSDSIKNHGTERKYISSSSRPGSINYTSIITKQKYSSSSSGIAIMRNLCLACGYIENLQVTCRCPTLSRDWKSWTDHPMELTWFQIAVPSYSFKYNSDRSNQMLTLTNRFYSDSIKNHGIERKYSSSSSIPGSINYTSIITEKKCSSSSSGIRNNSMIRKCSK